VIVEEAALVTEEGLKLKAAEREATVEEAAVLEDKIETLEEEVALEEKKAALDEAALDEED
jgi:hypothetical protein